MRKTDARIRYTQRVLKESFLTLLKQKPSIFAGVMHCFLIYVELRKLCDFLVHIEFFYVCSVTYPDVQ